ncbi:MAG: GxxExxY protein [Chloroflexi bacterium]|nr:GxxExxY protein [Chloroflexota bacterium]
MAQQPPGMRKPGLAAGAPHADLTYQIIGLAIQVRDDLGPGHRKAVYHNALRARFAGKLDFADEPRLAVLDEDSNVVFKYKPDFVIAGEVIVEIKAHSHPLTRNEVAQVLDYFAASDCNVALLINFGRFRLEWNRLFPPGKILEHRESRQRKGTNRPPNP